MLTIVLYAEGFLSTWVCIILWMGAELFILNTQTHGLYCWGCTQKWLLFLARLSLLNLSFALVCLCSHKCDMKDLLWGTVLPLQHPITPGMGLRGLVEPILSVHQSSQAAKKSHQSVTPLYPSKQFLCPLWSDWFNGNWIMTTGFFYNCSPLQTQVFAGAIKYTQPQTQLKEGVVPVSW